jgi:MFS family permease
VWTVLDDIGLQLLAAVAKFLPFAAGVFVGLFMSRRGVRTWLCWAVGLSVLAFLFAALLPSTERLQSAWCRHSDDYQACMESADDLGADDY